MSSTRIEVTELIRGKFVVDVHFSGQTFRVRKLENPEGEIVFAEQPVLIDGLFVDDYKVVDEVLDYEEMLSANEVMIESYFA